VGGGGGGGGGVVEEGEGDVEKELSDVIVLKGDCTGCRGLYLEDGCDGRELSVVLCVHLEGRVVYDE
jgi:hypothetical protein